MAHGFPKCIGNRSAVWNTGQMDAETWFVMSRRQLPSNAEGVAVVIGRTDPRQHGVAEGNSQATPKALPWSGAESNCRPSVFQTDALPTELPDRGRPPSASPVACATARRSRANSLAGTTGFEPATSGLTGRRELLTSPRPQRAPRGIRIPVSALKGRRPRPLDDGGGRSARITPIMSRSLQRRNRL